jgi:hypothetical protein
MGKILYEPIGGGTAATVLDESTPFWEGVPQGSRKDWQELIWRTHAGVWIVGMRGAHGGFDHPGRRLAFWQVTLEQAVSWFHKHYPGEAPDLLFEDLAKGARPATTPTPTALIPTPTPAPSLPTPSLPPPITSAPLVSEAQPLPPRPDPLRDEAALARALRRAKKPKQARLVEFMIGKTAAEFETLAEAVHGHAQTSDDAIEKNARTTSDSAAALGSRVRYEPRSGWVYKEIAAE